MIVTQRQDWIHRLFIIDVFLKGVDGALQLLFGILTLFYSTETFVRWSGVLTEAELKEDPGDYLANLILRLAGQLSLDIKLFLGIYLLFQGIIKIILVFSLLKGRLWGFIVTIILETFFLIYLIHRMIFRFSPWLLLLVIFNLSVILLVWIQYNRIKKVAEKHTMRPGIPQ